MSDTSQPLIERVARVLCGAAHSANAEGHDQHASTHVDRHWREHANQALAVVHALREPDAAMIAAGDAAVWKRMVEAALGEEIGA